MTDLRTASGQPPLGIGALAFRDDQGEIFEHDNPRYRSPSTRIGVLALEGGKYLAHPPGFRVDGKQHVSREIALRSAIAAMVRKARKNARAKEGQGTHWSEGYAGRVIDWALSLKPEKQGLVHLTTEDTVAPIGHPGMEQDVIGEPSSAPTPQADNFENGARDNGDGSPVASHDEAGVTDDAGGDLAGVLNQNLDQKTYAAIDAGVEISDPIVRDLVEAHGKRKQFPASHTFAMTTEVADGRIVSVATCKCGQVFKFGSNDVLRMDAACEAHWRRFDYDKMVDGRGQPIEPGDASRIAGGKTRKRKKNPNIADESAHPQSPSLRSEPASVPQAEAGSPLIEPAPIGAGENVVTSRDDVNGVEWSPLLQAAAGLAWDDKAAYQGFLSTKVRDNEPTGFDIEPDALNAALKPFQRDIVRWALRRGRAALFAGTGLGKTLQQLSWADQVARRHGPVLILTPLAVAQQTCAEAEKFGIPGVAYARDAATISSRIVVTNYDRLEKFDPARFAGVVLDESSILKSFDGKTRMLLTDAFARTRLKLACTATPAPNDYTELGTHSEFLGVLQQKEMLATWFVHDGASRATSMENHGQRQGSDWRLKGHAHDAFWRWLATWSVMIRHPRDLGYDDAGYDLPPLNRHQVLIKTEAKGDLLGGVTLARTLQERLAARRETIGARVAAAADIVNRAPDRQWLVWCNLNDESTALAAAIPGAVEVRGSDDPDEKASRLLAFARGEVRVLVSKPSIAGWGMNFQRCADMVFVGLNDSFEQLYQAVRRCWRFGQTREVNVHLIAADIEGEVVANLEAKEEQADYMAEAMVGHMRGLSVANLRSERTISIHDKPMQLPTWLKCA